MKFTSLLAVFALLQVSEAKDISCIRSSSGVECFDQLSLFSILENLKATSFNTEGLQ